MSAKSVKMLLKLVANIANPIIRNNSLIMNEVMPAVRNVKIIMIIETANAIKQMFLFILIFG